MDFRTVVLLCMVMYVSYSSGSPLHGSMPQKREAEAFEEDFTEGGVLHKEQIKVDLEKQTEVVHVGATQDTVEATMLIDYKANHMVIKLDKACNLLPINPAIGEKPEELVHDLESHAENQASNGDKNFPTFNVKEGSELSEEERAALSQDIQELCNEIPIFASEIASEAEDDAQIALENNEKRGCRVETFHACIPFWPFCGNYVKTVCG